MEFIKKSTVKAQKTGKNEEKQNEYCRGRDHIFSKERHRNSDQSPLK